MQIQQNVFALIDVSSCGHRCQGLRLSSLVGRTRLQHNIYDYVCVQVVWQAVVDWTVRLQLPAIKLQHDHSVTGLLHALLTTLTYLLTFFQVTWLQAAMIPEVSLLTD